MNTRSALVIAASLTALCAASGGAAQQQRKHPNIVFILADDIGYGDLSCYGATRVKTPNVDGLAAQGLRFRDGHAAAATCTPSRYSLMTGEYAWRKKGTGILPGDAAMILEPGRTTLPSLLRTAGYATGAVGKWHLGLGSETGKQDWNAEIKPGPREVGFDYSFLIPATGDRTPCVFVEDQKVVGLDPADPIQVGYEMKVGDDPTGRERPDLLTTKPSHGHDQTIVNGVSRIGTMSGGKKARWKDEDIADTVTGKAVSFLERQRKDKPFFLYFATHDIHVPRLPHPRFQGKTDMGPRGDALVQFDWSVGQITATLKRLGLEKDTLVILSSDNGPVVDDGYQDQAVAKLGDHRPAGPLRGGKYSNFEAGGRVPFITRWPARIKPGVSDALVCQIDTLASVAALTGQPVPSTAPDSRNVLAALTGEDKRGRDYLIKQGSQISVRKGPWKYIPPARGPKVQANTGVESGNDPAGQLYDLSKDLGETQNLITEQPERAAELAAIREKELAAGQNR